MSLPKIEEISLFASLGAFLIVIGCTTDKDAAAEELETVDFSEESCPVIEAGSWRAWLNRAPTVGTAQARLIVEGTPSLPTPGYEARWKLGPTDRAIPPGQVIHLAFSAPIGMVTTIVTDTPVRFELPTPIKSYRHVTIVCGGTVLAKIEPVDVAQ
ncbi:MAG: hypothetical protein AAF720_00610 [Pseudomonadota bacterium]